MEFGFDAVKGLVWVDTATPDQIARARSGALCKQHADTLSVPRGWHLEDRRQPVPQLFRTPTPTDGATGVTGVTEATQRAARRRRSAPKPDESPAEQADGSQSLFDGDDRGARHLY